MDAAVVTVGDELLAGDIENTNATWIARQLADRGVAVREIAVVPDEVEAIAGRVRALAGAHDAVVVTGGLGGTPDDVTLDGVAAAFDRGLEVHPGAKAHVEETIEGRDRDYELRIDFEAEGSLPEGSRPLLNEVGISPGCVLENVYVLPGVPREMRAMFEGIEGEFAGERYVRTTHTETPEANIAPVLAEARESFGVAVGSYPDMETGVKRIKVTGDDPGRVDEAHDWLAERLR